PDADRQRSRGDRGRRGRGPSRRRARAWRSAGARERRESVRARAGAVTLAERPRTATGLRLRSAVPGRTRWDAPPLRRRPRVAAAAELALAARPGIVEVEANPRPGRVLVRYDATLDAGAVEGLVAAALAVPPLSREELLEWQERRGAERRPDDTCGH